jgi:hypothetical protein
MSQHLRTRARAGALESALGLGPWSLQDVLSCGWTVSQVRQAVAAGRLVRPHRGVLDVPRPGVSDVTDAAARIRAALLRAASSAAASHSSAAVLHGLWLPSRGDGLVHVTRAGEPDRCDHGVRIHGSGLPESHVTVLDRIRTTTIERTAIDCARGRPLRDALTIVDSAARHLVGSEGYRERVVRESLSARSDASDLARSRLSQILSFELGWPGTAIARDAVRHLDVASESPLESWSRGLMIESGVPMPERAFAVSGASGLRYFADFSWPGLRVLGEADGTAKYGRSSDEVARAVRRERHRQRDLEDAGWTVVRWDSTESPAVIIARLRGALLEASRRH